METFLFSLFFFFFLMKSFFSSCSDKLMLRRRTFRSIPSTAFGQYSAFRLHNTATAPREVKYWTVDDIGKKAHNLLARIHRTRVKGKQVAFAVLRQPGGETVQAVTTNPALVEKIKALTPETVVRVSGFLQKADVKGTKCTNIEISCSDIETVSAAASPLPILVEEEPGKVESEGTTPHAIATHRMTRLEARVIDLRRTRNNAILQLTGEIVHAFRAELRSGDFTEIITPKLQSSVSEGGSSVFSFSYFGRDAFLAQSPQLHKQMCVQADFPRVYEIGPVFRAENSNTHRHLCEFTGLDAEMIINDEGRNYFEVLDVLEKVVGSMIDGIFMKPHVLANAGFSVPRPSDSTAPTRETGLVPLSRPEVAVPTSTVSSLELGNDTTLTESKCPYGARISCNARRALRIPFDGAMELLIQKHIIDKKEDDFNIAMERKLGELVKERYGVDVFVCDQFPTSARPFYTMLDPKDSTKTRSFDLYVYGEEICSGAQRVHSHIDLVQRAMEKGISLEPLRPYLDSFKYGAWPHGGFGIGLQRFLMLVLKLGDVREATFFPRDPKRLTP